jgi:ATP-dependent phosphofructokinase / diphosphate-dependent phosphofructokinase
MKIGVLTGGGDAPGTNAVIRAIVRKAIKQYEDEVLGIRDGWHGLLEADFAPLDQEAITAILTRGGSILGFSRTNPFKSENGVKRILKNIEKSGIDAIIVIGGDDTLGVACKLGDFGVRCVGVPKTIDNDLSGTDYTFGFNTAVSIATEALDRLRTTAEAHQRVIILEVMGRYTGWIAFESGLAGGADVILIPEKPFDVSEICDYINQRQKRGRNFSVVVVSEGAKPKGGKEIIYSDGTDEFGNVRLGGVGYYLGREVEKRIGIEARVVVLGHIQRGGTPTAFDRVLGTRFGLAAIDFVHEGKFGCMVGVQGNRMVSVALKDVAGKRKTVSQELYAMASVFFG